MGDREDLAELRRLEELEARAAASQPRQAPGSKPLDYGKMASEGLAALRGDTNLGPIQLGPIGGPYGAALRMGNYAMNNLAPQFIDRLAYKGGGAVTDILAPHVPPEVAGGAGYVANVATQAAPVVAGALLGKSAQPASDAAAKRLMMDALNPPSNARSTGDAAKAVTTLLEEGISPTSGGAAKLRTMIDALNKRASAEIAGAAEKGVVVNKAFPASEVEGALQRFRMQPAPAADEAAILNVWKEFSGRHGAEIPVELADAIKRGGQQILSKKYGQLGPASEAAEKAITRGLRLGTEEVVPTVAPINAKQSALINALKLVEPRASRGGGPTAFGMAPIAGSPEMMAVAAVDRNPWIKSLLARALYNTGPLNVGVGAGAGGAAGHASGRSE